MQLTRAVHGIVPLAALALSQRGGLRGTGLDRVPGGLPFVESFLRLLQPGAAKALGRAAGIGLRVVGAGTIRVGDEVRVLVDPAMASDQSGA